MISYILLLKRPIKQLVSIIADTALITFSFIIAMILRLENLDFMFSYDSWSILIILIPVNISIFLILGIYQNIIRYFSIISLYNIFLGVLLSSLLIFTIDNFYNFFMPRSVAFIYLVVAVILLSGTRIFASLIFADDKRIIMRENIAIYGAGEAGIQLLNHTRKLKEYNTIAFIDDDPQLANKTVDGIKIYSGSAIDNLIIKYNIKSILICIPSISPPEKSQLINKLEKYNVKIKTVPNLSDIILGNLNINDIDFVSVSEILTRQTILPDKRLLKININDKNVLVTGAGGSIGSELCRQIVLEKPNKLVLFDISEFALYKIHEEVKAFVIKKKLEIQIIEILGSVTNKDLICNILEDYKIETIYHAAAFKHVPILENNVVQGIQNNVFGSYNVVTAALEYKVKNFTFISTDKAVEPTNIMGASKRIGELICQSYIEKNIDTKFSIVRFGNVLDSSGSVVPRFRQQIKAGGPVTVTHEDVTRYFMTIPEAAQLVIQAGAINSKGTSIYVLDMGEPYKILDLAKRMIKLHGFRPFIKNKDELNKSSDDIEIIFTGLRSGEKMHEQLLIGNDPVNTTHPRILSCTEEIISEEDLENLLSSLKIACMKNSTKEIIELLKSSHIGFRSYM